jgi:ABC-type polysaccharide/polyol phosphate transport system ATPase subunit
MTPASVLEVRGVSKRFAHSMRHALRYGLTDIFRSAVGSHDGGAALRAGEFWALREVSLALRPGESVGILGRNGAGKSTLLKLIAGIYAPTSGRIDVDGRVGAIIELGAAFAPNLTGRENIRPQALLNGFDEARLRAKLDDIIAFAELGEFIDAPVQHYSTGMRARLGFAIAAHSAPDVLLIDEVLAVGDLTFQNKCLKFVEAFRNQGGTVIFVGHSTHQMQAACDRGIILERGAVEFDGPMVDALDSYMKLAPAPLDAARESSPAAGRTPAGASSSTFHVERVSLEPDGGCLPAVLFDLRLDEPLEMVRFAAALASERDGAAVAGALAEPLSLGAGRQCIRMRLGDVKLIPGPYLLRLSALAGASSYPVWARGWEDAPLLVQVTGDASVATVLFESIGFRVRLDATAELVEVEP